MSDLTMRVILFADGHRGSATQIYQIVEHPRVYVIARRESRRDPFRETFVVGPPNASGLDVMRKQGMTEYSTLAEALAKVASEAPIDPEFGVVVDADQEGGWSKLMGLTSIQDVEALEIARNVRKFWPTDVGHRAAKAIEDLIHERRLSANMRADYARVSAYCKELSYATVVIRHDLQQAKQGLTSLATALGRGGHCLRLMMEAYERRVRSGCTPEQIEKRPWECAEYLEAAKYMRTMFARDPGPEISEGETR